MSKKTIAYTLFIIGLLLLFMHTSLTVVWQLSGSPGTYPLSRSTLLYYAQGFSPIFGAVLLFVSGLVYEKSETVK